MWDLGTYKETSSADGPYSTSSSSSLMLASSVRFQQEQAIQTTESVF